MALQSTSPSHPQFTADEFVTASEGEEDEGEKAVCTPATGGESQGEEEVATAVKFLLQFKLNKVSI